IASSLCGCAAVLDFPRVVEGVPGDAACGIPLRPASLDQRLPVRRLLQRVEHRCAKGTHRHAVTALGYRKPPSELSRIDVVRPEDVIDDLVAIATATAWAFTELGGRRCGHLVEDRPGRFHQ